MLNVEHLDTEARSILRRNDRGHYTVPTDRLYPYQWNWDSAFAAMGFAEFDLDRAWIEIETLLEAQWPSGMVPHIIFHQHTDGYFPGPDVWGCNSPVPSSGISQPPVLATITRQVWERNADLGNARITAIYSKLVEWHRWFISWRLDSSGAVCATHPWEAGRDNAPDWDHALSRINVTNVSHYERRDTEVVDPKMRPTKFDYDRYIWLIEHGREREWDDAKLKKSNPFRMADPTMTFILLRSNWDLISIGKCLGKDVTDLEEWNRILEAGANSLWNPSIECFDSRDAHTGEWSDCISNASFLCWYAGIESKSMLQHFERMLARTRFMVPSHDPDSRRFDRYRYWRGPVWPVINSLIATGLAGANLPRQANAVRVATSRLIANGGFSEYFDPQDGTPAGGHNFTWTAAIWLCWASMQTGKDQWAPLN